MRKTKLPLWMSMWLSLFLIGPAVGFGQGQAESVAVPKTIKLKVLVLNYDPLIGGKRLHEELSYRLSVAMPSFASNGPSAQRVYVTVWIN